MVPADDDKSSKLSSSKGSGVSSDMGKMLSSMNKSLKTFGKAMSQVAEKYETIGDDSSTGAQSHAQVSNIKYEDCGYAFVMGTLIWRNQILLDSQSSVHVFCNPNFVSDIRSAGMQLQLKRNGGKLPIYNVADFEGFAESV